MKIPIETDSISIEIANNVKDLLSKLVQHDPDMTRLGMSRVTFGDPLYLETSDLPLICINFERWGSEQAGVGHRHRSDIIYVFRIKIMSSENLSNFDFASFWAISEKVYEWITLNDYNIIVNCNTNKVAFTGLNPEFSEMTIGYERKIVNTGATRSVVTASFSVQATRTRQKAVRAISR